MPFAVAGAAVAAGASVAGSQIAAGASKSAASAQQSAADAATIATEKQQALIQGNLAPYQRLGTDTLGQVTPNIAPYSDLGQGSQSSSQLLNQAAAENPGVYLPSAAIPTTNALSAAAPGSMTQAQLEQTPGYQFTLQQGLQATQNSAAARGLGVSGAALKGAASYATGLADSTYKDQFNIAQQQFANQNTIFGANQTAYSDSANQEQNQFNQQQQRFANLGTLNSAAQGNLTNAYNRQIGLSTLGENAANASGAQGLTATNQAGQFYTGGANAYGAGQIAAGNAAQSGLNSLSNLFGQGSAQNQLAGIGGSSIYGNASGLLNNIADYFNPATSTGASTNSLQYQAGNNYNAELGY